MRTERFTKPLDELETDLIVTTLLASERPPRGVTGLIDWRLNGFISRLLQAGTITGATGEVVLLPLRRRLPARRLLLIGLGTPDQLTLTNLRHVAYKVGKSVAGLKALDVAVSCTPARDEQLSGETEASFLDALRQAQMGTDVLVRWLAPSVVSHVWAAQVRPAEAAA